jgi:hypothetical protein
MIAQLDMKIKTTDEKYYQFKLNSILKTLPIIEEMSMWSSFEYGCKELYGIDEEFYKTNSIEVIRETINQNDIIQALQTNTKESCIICHDFRTFLKYIVVHPNAKRIEFDNFNKFRQIAASLKGHELTQEDYKLSEMYYTNDQKFYQLDSFVVNVDEVFFDWDKFDKMMGKLYNYLGFDDYQPNLVKDYWSQYINLHNI